MHTRTPITDAGIAAQDNSVMARIAAGELSREAIFGRAEKPYAGAVVRDIVGEMADFITETGSGTRDDLLLRFSDAEITKHLQAARDRANRRWTRRAA